MIGAKSHAIIDVGLRYFALINLNKIKRLPASKIRYGILARNKSRNKKAFVIC